MQIQKIIFINRAPFEHLELDFKQNGINVLTAINGKGKTTIISHIVDAFHELAREAYRRLVTIQRTRRCSRRLEKGEDCVVGRVAVLLGCLDD